MWTYIVYYMWHWCARSRIIAVYALSLLVHIFLFYFPPRASYNVVAPFFASVGSADDEDDNDDDDAYACAVAVFSFVHDIRISTIVYFSEVSSTAMMFLNLFFFLLSLNCFGLGEYIYIKWKWFGICVYRFDGCCFSVVVVDAAATEITLFFFFFLF